MKNFSKILIVVFCLFALLSNSISTSAMALQKYETKICASSTDIEAVLKWIKMVPSIKPPAIPEFITTIEMPLYNQLDYPDVPFAEGSVASDGCGITCMAMVATYLLNEEHLPDELALAYNEMGLSNAQRMENAAIGLGIDFYKVYTWPETIECLKNGKVIIALMGEQSLFTNTGHFIILKGITSDDKILINDPNGKNYELYPNEFENGFEQYRVIKGFRGCWVFG